MNDDQKKWFDRAVEIVNGPEDMAVTDKSIVKSYMEQEFKNNPGKFLNEKGHTEIAAKAFFIIGFIKAMEEK